MKEWTYLDTHDALADPIKNLISKNKMLEILNKFESLKVELISDMRPGGNGIEVRAKKIKPSFISVIIFTPRYKSIWKKIALKNKCIRV